VKELLKIGANPHPKNLLPKYNDDPLSLATRKKKQKVVTLLESYSLPKVITVACEKKTVANPCKKEKETFFKMVESNSYARIGQLCKDKNRFFNPNWLDENSETALIKAVKNKNYELASTLVRRCKVNLYLKDRRGKISFDHARVKGNETILKLLSGGLPKK
jgi:hypothetical protein